MGVLLGLAAAVCWGLGDYLIASLTHRIGTYRALCATQIGSLISWVVLLLVLSHTKVGVFAPSTSLWGLAFLAAICHVGALLLTYRSFEIGTLSLVSPIISSFSVVTAALALLSGERLPRLGLIGVGVLVAGIVLATRAPSAGQSETQKNHAAGIPEAILSALGFGVMFWLFEKVEGGLGYIWPLILMKIMATTSSLWIVSHQRRKANAGRDGVPSASVATEQADSLAAASQRSTIWTLAAGVAVSDTAAWVAYTYGVQQLQYVTVVTAVASLFSVVTVLLAWAFLRERLAPNQWVGVAIIFLGILLVSLKLKGG